MSISLKLGSSDWNLWPLSRDYEEIFALLASEGISHVELGIYEPSLELIPANRARIRELSDKFGLKITAALFSLTAEHWPTGALSNTNSEFLEECTWFLEALTDLGISNANIWTGVDFQGCDLTAVEATLDGLDTLAEGFNGTVSIEYKADTVFSNGKRLIELIGKRKNLKVLVDTGHAFALQEDIVELLNDLFDRDLLGAMHLGDALYGDSDADLPCGRIHDFTPILRTLEGFHFPHSINYDLYGAATDTNGPGPLPILRESHAYITRTLLDLEPEDVL